MEGQLWQETVSIVVRILPDSASKIVQDAMVEISKSYAGSKVSFALLVSLWWASAGMSAVIDTLNAAYEVKETRSFRRKNAIAVGLTVSTAVLLGASSAIIFIASDLFEAYSHGLLFTILKIIEWPAALSLILLGLAFVYYLGPDLKDQKWHWVTPGAIAAVILWLITSSGLKVYLHFFDTYSVTYGSLGAVIVLLLWFYLSGAAVLLGAEMNTVLEDAAATQGERDAKRKGQKEPQLLSGGVPWQKRNDEEE